MSTVLVCDICGSENIIQKEWRFVNSGKYASETADNRKNRFCQDCCKTVNFLTQEEYIFKKTNFTKSFESWNF